MCVLRTYLVENQNEEAQKKKRKENSTNTHIHIEKQPQKMYPQQKHRIYSPFTMNPTHLDDMLSHM